jgi:HSF-type DNA-binding
MNNLSAEEQAAASVVAGLAGKRNRDDSPDAAGGMKVARLLEEPTNQPPVAAIFVENDASDQEPPEELQPFPFFYYKDYSTVKDPDSLTPLTAPGRVPNFPAKMHAILSRPDLADVICYMPHGRSWKVLKPREFEIRVIPTYFEHAKFSSFIRQANGWGFRRLTTGKDRNSYYHPLFLRALPHLCKDMKRPGVAKKLAADPEHEPDLYKVSEIHPVPTKYEDDSILLQCTLQGGPKARMPIYSGSLTSSSIGSTFMDVQRLPEESKKAAAASITAPAATQLTPRDQEVLSSFQASLGASEMHKKPAAATAVAAASSVAVPAMVSPMMFPPAESLSTPAPPSSCMTMTSSTSASGCSNKLSTLAAANQLAFGNPQFAAAFQASSAASQFAAGFAAAAALSHAQFQSMLNTMQQQQQQGVQQQGVQQQVQQPNPLVPTPHNFSL